MDLKDFIKITIVEISQGIKEAQDVTSDLGVIVNPEGMSVGSKGDKILRHDGWRYVQDLEINVAISVSEGEGTKAGLGVVTGLFQGGASASNESANQTVSTVKLNIPVALPVSKTPEGYKKKKKNRVRSTTIHSEKS